MKASLSHRTHFNAAYQLFNPNFSEEENINAFGEHNPSNPPFHGHNYNLEIKFFGEIDKKTGRILDKNVVKEIIKKHIEERYDHKNLYKDLDDFKDSVPTVEMLCVKIYEILKPLFPNNIELTVIVEESKQNLAEYP